MRTIIGLFSCPDVANACARALDKLTPNGSPEDVAIANLRDLVEFRHFMAKLLQSEASDVAERAERSRAIAARLRGRW